MNDDDYVARLTSGCPTDRDDLNDTVRRIASASDAMAEAAGTIETLVATVNRLSLEIKRRDAQIALLGVQLKHLRERGDALGRN